MTSIHAPLKLNNLSIYSGISIFAVMGGFTSSYGVMVPYFREKFSLDLAQSGFIFFAHGVTALIGVVIGTITVSKFKAAYVGGLGAPLMGLGAILIGTAPSWNITLIGVTVVGVGFGACDATISQFLSRGGSEKAVRLVNILNAGFAIGAVVGPILIAGAVPDLFSQLLFAWAAVFFVVGYMFISNTSGYLKRDHSTAKPDGHKFVFSMLLLGIAFYVGVEVGASGWIPTYMIDKNYSAQMGATALALFFLSLAAGRILILPLAKKFSPTQIVLASSILIILSLFFIGSTSFALLGFAIMGFVCGPVFPTAMVWAVRINPGDPRTAGFMMFAAIAGASISPSLMGIVMQRSGTEILAWLLMVPALLSLAVYGLAAKQKISEHIEHH
jgi:FHS family glucose/mannose:H+ symporter-like MFS transporter